MYPCKAKIQQAKWFWGVIIMKELILRYFDAFANLYGIIPMKRAYRIIEKQNPELNLTKEQFAEIVNEFDFPD